MTYIRGEDALRAIQSVNNIVVDGRTLRASLGTTKYCSHFMKNQPCPKPDCMYLHEIGKSFVSCHRFAFGIFFVKQPLLAMIQAMKRLVLPKKKCSRASTQTTNDCCMNNSSCAMGRKKAGNVVNIFNCPNRFF